MFVLKQGIVIGFSLCVCVIFTGCPSASLYSKINGVFSVGSQERSHEEYLIAQVYYETPPIGFHPAEFSWDLKNEKASLLVFQEDKMPEKFLEYHFHIVIPDLIGHSGHSSIDGKKIIYEGTLVSLEDSSVFLYFSVSEYEAQMEENGRVFIFNRRDFNLTLFQNENILGYFKGAEMDLKKWKNLNVTTP